MCIGGGRGKLFTVYHDSWNSLFFFFPWSSVGRRIWVFHCAGVTGSSHSQECNYTCSILTKRNIINNGRARLFSNLSNVFGQNS